MCGSDVLFISLLIEIRENENTSRVLWTVKALFCSDVKIEFCEVSHANCVEIKGMFEMAFIQCHKQRVEWDKKRFKSTRNYGLT